MGSSLPTSVPLLDVNRQNAPLREEILASLTDIYDSGRFILGPDVEALEAEMAAYCGTDRAVACASGTDALLLALMALGVGPGDEVLLPSFTFFATAGSVWRLGARPVFVDIEPRTFNIDPELLEGAITPATKAILPVHLFGTCADMGAINQIAERHGLPVVEDAAQAIGADVDRQRAGSLGTVGCFSFYPTKNLGGMGDGGMLTTDDGALVERLRMLRNHGQHPTYYHAVVGTNSRLDSMQAAVLRVKLKHLETWTTQREENAARYQTLLEEAGLAERVGLPATVEGKRQVWNQYTIRVPDGERDALLAHLREGGIGAAIYYPVPLHRQECFAEMGMGPGSLPETERAAEEVISLPIFAELTAAEQEAVVGRIARFYAGAGSRSEAA